MLGNGDRMAVASQIHRARSKIANISLILRAEFCQVFGLNEVTSSNLKNFGSQTRLSHRDETSSSSNQCKRRTNTQFNKSSRKARI